MSGAVVLFAKTPGLSCIKTRLAVEIGAEAAAEFYGRSIKCIEELAVDVMQQSGGDLVPYWAVGEQEGLDHELWQKFDRLWTGEGGLGERLDHVYAALLKKHDHVILIGTDSPQLQSSILLEAHACLKARNGFVVGAAEDGGYYLFGGHVPLPRALWLSVPYSVSSTCAVFTEKLAPYGAIRFLAPNFDVDVAADLSKLPACAHLMTGRAQKDLLRWIDQRGPISDFAQ